MDSPTSRPAAGKLKRSLTARVGLAAAGFLGGFFGGLRDFLVRGSVVDLAVAVVVGTAFTNLVNAVVSDFMTPTLAMFFDAEKTFANLTFTARGSVFPWGHFVNVLLTFVLIMLIVFFLVVTPTNALMHATDHKTRTRDCPECLSEIPQRARRCKFCCAAVEPTAYSKQASRAMARQQTMSQPPQIVVVATTAPTSPTAPDAGSSKPIPRAASLPASVSFARVPSGKNRVAPLRPLEPIASVPDLASSGASSADGGGGGDAGAAAAGMAPQPAAPAAPLQRVESNTWGAVYQPPAPPPPAAVDSLSAVEQSAGSAVERSAGSAGSARGAAREGNPPSARTISWRRMPTGITAVSDGV